MTSATATTPVVKTFLDLASIPSPSHEEQRIATWIRGYCEALGLTVEEDDAGERIPAGCGNMTVRIPATTAGTPIFLCAHVDTVALADEVVPVLRDDGRIENEREAILGGDDKSAVAVMLEVVREIVEEEIPHAGVELVLTPCEEVGLVGAKHYEASRLQARFGYVFDHASDIGKIVARAPSQISLRATFRGRASHSGIAPEEGRSAIKAAATAIDRMTLGRIDPESTANVGIIEGGTGSNIIPERCWVRAEARSLNHQRVGEIADEMVQHMVDAATEHGTDVDVDLRDEYRAYAFTESSPPVKLAMAALRAAGYEPTLVDCGGGSDGNVFNTGGKPCVNLCNGMRQIHTADEHIYVGDLEGMLRVARELVLQARGDESLPPPAG